MRVLVENKQHYTLMVTKKNMSKQQTAVEWFIYNNFKNNCD
jgi:hypothetical protein